MKINFFFLRNVLNKYNNWCSIKPIRSSIISVGVVLSLGDLLTQFLEHKYSKYQ